MGIENFGKLNDLEVLDTLCEDVVGAKKGANSHLQSTANIAVCRHHFLTVAHSGISSATTFLEKSRKVVLDKWFCKLGFFFWSTTFLEPEKKVVYSINPPCFLVNHFSQTTFLKPLLSNLFSQTTFLDPLRKVVAH